MAEPALALVGGSLVDHQTGEISLQDEQALRERILELEGNVADLERDARSMRATITHYMNVAEDKRKKYPKRAIIERVFDYWRTESGHSKAKLGPKRFDAMRTRIEEGYSEAEMMMAVAGLVARAFVDKGVKYDDLDVAMRSEEQLEKYANKAPRDVRHSIKTRLDTQLSLA